MEQTLHNVILEFSKELCKLENNKPGCGPTLNLTMSRGRYHDGPPKVTLSCQFYDGADYCTVKAASLGTLMDEVYRRLGFADKELVKIDRIESALQALPHLENDQ